MAHCSDEPQPALGPPVCPHCGQPMPSTEPKPERVEQTCWRAPNPHPPHQWRQQDIGVTDPLWCPGVKGTTMY